MKFDLVSETRGEGEGVTCQAIVFCAPSVDSEAHITYNKRNNKAPKKALLFGFFVSFVMMVPAERPGC